MQKQSNKQMKNAINPQQKEKTGIRKTLLGSARLAEKSCNISSILDI
jgi:hypothetical protein